MMVNGSSEAAPMLLVADSDLGRATALHNACAHAGLKTIVARDLPTALLMISQHLFEGAIISSKIMEESDGWSLGAVFHMAFPHAYIAVIAREKNVPALQSAINSGVDHVFESATPAEEVVATIVGVLPQKSGESSPSTTVQ
jgi:DNA-binding NtrC family response regulator